MQSKHFIAFLRCKVTHFCFLNVIAWCVNFLTKQWFFRLFFIILLLTSHFVLLLGSPCWSPWKTEFPWEQNLILHRLLLQSAFPDDQCLWRTAYHLLLKFLPPVLHPVWSPNAWLIVLLALNSQNSETNKGRVDLGAGFWCLTLVIVISGFIFWTSAQVIPCQSQLNLRPGGWGHQNQMLVWSHERSQ